MRDSVQQFYDDLADEYHFIFADWQQSVQRQAATLHQFLSSRGENPPRSILDCTCGIGTQTIGLALKGYVVHGADLSPRAIERAREYAQQFSFEHPPTFAPADLLEPPERDQQVDVVLACDNAFAHFHSDDALAQAVKHMVMQLKSGGLLLISIRDYDALLSDPPRVTPVSVTDRADGRHAVFQVWDWDEDYRSYHMEMFIMRPDEHGGYRTHSYKSHLRAIKRDELTGILEAQGLLDVTWHLPETSGYYQPIVTARKP